MLPTELGPMLTPEFSAWMFSRTTGGMLCELAMSALTRHGSAETLAALYQGMNESAGTRAVVRSATVAGTPGTKPKKPEEKTERRASKPLMNQPLVRGGSFVARRISLVKPAKATEPEKKAVQ